MCSKIIILTGEIKILMDFKLNVMIKSVNEIKTKLVYARLRSV